MALDTGAFATGMEALLTDMESRTENAKGEYAQRLGGLIKDLIMSGELAAGLAVNTPAGLGATAIPGKIT